MFNLSLNSIVITLSIDLYFLQEEPDFYRRSFWKFSIHSMKFTKTH